MLKINKTLEIYGHLSGQKLVVLTYKLDSPYYHSGAGQKKKAYLDSRHVLYTTICNFNNNSFRKNDSQINKE